MSEPSREHGTPQPIDAPARPERAYSPIQVAGAALLGGPLGGSVLLASNFVFFGIRLGSSQTILLGVFSTFIVMGIAAVVPDSTPDVIIPAIYVAVFHQISQRSHGAQYKAFIASGGIAYSHWRVFGIGLLCLLVVFLMMFAVEAVFPGQQFLQDAA